MANRFNPFQIRPVVAQAFATAANRPPVLSAINQLENMYPAASRLVAAVWTDPDALTFLYYLWKATIADSKRQRDSGWAEYKLKNPNVSQDPQFLARVLEAANRTIELWDSVLEAIKRQLESMGKPPELQSTTAGSIG